MFVVYVKRIPCSDSLSIDEKYIRLVHKINGNLFQVAVIFHAVFVRCSLCTAWMCARGMGIFYRQCVHAANKNKQQYDNDKMKWMIAHSPKSIRPWIQVCVYAMRLLDVNIQKMCPNRLSFLCPRPMFPSLCWHVRPIPLTMLAPPSFSALWTYWTGLIVHRALQIACDRFSNRERDREWGGKISMAS